MAYLKKLVSGNTLTEPYKELFCMTNGSHLNPTYHHPFSEDMVLNYEQSVIDSMKYFPVLMYTEECSACRSAQHLLSSRRLSFDLRVQYFVCVRLSVKLTMTATFLHQLSQKFRINVLGTKVMYIWFRFFLFSYLFKMLVILWAYFVVMVKRLGRFS